MKPHKHAELIKAWANGAEIEWRSNAVFSWVTCHSPMWDDAGEFRIKPEKKWYRVAEFVYSDETNAAAAYNEDQETNWPESKQFSRWITGRIYYE